MKILVVSAYGESAYLWLRLVGEGNEVRVFIRDDYYRKEILQDLVDKVEDYRPFVSWCDFVLFDQNDLVKEWDLCSKLKPCFGGSEFGNMLEKDRTFAREVFEYIGLKKLESETFKTVDEAQEHLRTHKVLHVVKPFGGNEIGSEDIIISEDPTGEDAIDLLHQFKEKKIKFKGIEIEERKIGIECALSAWSAGSHGFIGQIELNFEHKRRSTGDSSHMTGEMGTAMTYVDRDNKFFKATLAKMEKLCKQMDYRGQIDISFIATEDGFDPLELTTRLGYPACALNISLQKTSLTDLFSGLAKGTLKDNEVKPGWCVGVVVVAFGFPFTDVVKKRSIKTPIFNWEKHYDSVFLYEAKAGMHDKEPGLVTSGGLGIPFVICDTGPTLEAAKKAAYSHLKINDRNRVLLPNGEWRQDIGDRVIAKKSDIIKWGILNEGQI